MPPASVARFSATVFNITHERAKNYRFALVGTFEAFGAFLPLKKKVYFFKKKKILSYTLSFIFIYLFFFFLDANNREKNVPNVPNV